MKLFSSLFLLLFICCTPENSQVQEKQMPLPSLSPIDGKRAMELVQKQLDFGPRHLNSDAAEKCASFIADFGRKLGYNVKVDIWSEGSGKNSRVFRNIICTKKGQGSQSVVCGSHYDTKILKEFPKFIGANDGASSTALMMHAMEQIAKSDQWQNHCTIHFVFFDGEEALVNYTDTDGLNGSIRYVRNMYMKGENTKCRAMILMDMIGDKDFKLTIPTNSTEDLIKMTQKIASEKGLSKYVSVMDSPHFHDDHKPFLQAGIPAIDLIDFEYGEKTPDNGGGAFWHNDKDTIDKLSAESLEICGTLFKHLLWQVSNNPIVKKD
ncbi:MAG: M28 family peptidase [Lentisphaeraceae bacterium]|nr:M28 family peptidase [Lentisphaeraceae bacterium]